MYKIITASSDNYITNKYIDNFRVTDANAGSAGTLDLFKLYNESFSTDDSLVELSRLLLKFDLGDIRELNQKKCSINHPSFNVTLKLFDVYGGQTTPSGFHVRLYPLSQSFDEGRGRDIVKYRDLGSSNFITASILNGNINMWNSLGANASGVLNDENIDIISTGDLEDGEGEVNLYKDVYFKTGKEDLEIDVTKIISGTISGLIPDCGFRVSFSPDIESDNSTYFVKRFFSRNAQNPTKRPQLIVKYDDSIQDYHKSMNFNVSGSLFLNNIVNGEYKNILSGSTTNPGTLEEVSGDDCILLKVFTGSYEKYITGSSYSLGEIKYKGVYSSSFLIEKYDDLLVDHINNSGSIKFTTVWTDLSEKTFYHSGSFTVYDNNISSFSNSNRRLVISITNLKKEYLKNSIARFRVFVENVDKIVRYVKIPKEKDSEIFYNMKYAVIDVDTNQYIIPFDKNGRSTHLSVDSDGMYFDIDTSSLPPKRIYKIAFLLSDIGEERIFTKTASTFRVI